MTLAMPNSLDLEGRPHDTRIVVAMSGGVDSSVAASLLLRQGYDVQGLFMSNWDEDEDGYCTAAEDFQDARSVCEQLGIPLHRVSFAGEYRERVFAYFLEEYRAGRTPNPDVLCNREIKFGVALRYAERLGAQYFATGHYARLLAGEDGPQLLKARDAAKDQSYFLHAVDPRELARTLMPLGELEKSAVRARARSAGLPVFDKPDSTGICFIGERPFRDFLAQYLPPEPGPIETPEGELLGEHQGLHFYTLGQRGGLGIGGKPGAADAPWYVVAKDFERKTLVAAQAPDPPRLLPTSLEADRVHWIAEEPPPVPAAVQVRVRYRQKPVAASLEQAEGTLRLRFARPVRAVTPGQYAVIYAGDVCLGGGRIIRHDTLADQGVRPG